MTDNISIYYDVPEKHLQQGDIFRINLVGPVCDEEARLFRAKDGRHGSVVFEEGCEGHVFSIAALERCLLAVHPRTDLHTEPFGVTKDGHRELVIAYAGIFHYFIVASHTCDVSGVDKKALPWSVILPVYTLSETCQSVRFPWQSQDEQVTVHVFVRNLLKEPDVLDKVPELTYSTQIRRLVAELLDSGNLEGKVLEDVRKIKKYLTEYYKKNIMHPLPASIVHGLPESYVDFSSVFTIPTVKLSSLMKCRFVRVAEPYRSDLAQRFANLFARATLPRPMAPGDQ